MNRWNLIRILTLAVALLGGAQPGLAQTLGPVVFDSGAMQANADQGFFSDPSANQETAGRFTLGANTTVAGIRWWGSHATGTPQVNNFTVRIYDTSGGLPSTLLHSFNLGSNVNKTADGVVVSVLPQFRYEASLSTFSLGAGTYAVAVLNDTDASPNWQWSTKSGDTSGLALRGIGGSWSSPADLQVAFQLTGESTEPSAVPEPGALFLFLPALGLVALVSRSRRPLRETT